jgi:4-alpha-glucanotransferase
MTDSTMQRPLHLLARLYGVQTAYRNMRWELKNATPEALIAALRCLGAPVSTLGDVPGAMVARLRALWGRAVQPVLVVWDGTGFLDLRLPAKLADGPAYFRLEMENGPERTWREDLSALAPRRTVDLDGSRYVSKRLTFAGTLPAGYHRLSVELGGAMHGALIVSAPTRAYGLPDGDDGRQWGVFLPLYALRSRQDWGAGDFTDLEALMSWTRGLGGTLVGTLPLLAAYLDEPCDPAPYIPASRLFWNEFYLDVTRTPELAISPRAKALLEDAGTAREIEELRAAPHVDYRRLMTLKRKVLEEMARSLFASESPRLDALRRAVCDRPQLDDYARFRATVERRRALWDRWPEPLRSGVLRPEDYDEDAARYHMYVQWLADEQLGELSDKADAAGAGLYLDLPLGVHRHGYDTWRERDAFVLDASGGAPPDVMFTGGQDWGLAPLHPEVSRHQGYRYTLGYLRQHMRRANALRIDHVMGLHRLYWIPKGIPAAEGVYVRYPADEMCALLSLESHRNHCAIVGENLGTVPWAVDAMLQKHGLHRMYVMQYALEPGPEGEPLAIALDTVASINTHDMFPFEGFRQGHDVDDRHALGLMNDEARRAEHERHESLRRALAGFLKREGLLSEDGRPSDLVRGVLLHMARSDARIVLVNLEDLWLETQPQNVPGTWLERPNWIRKGRLSLEEFRDEPFVVEVLREIDRARRQRSD